MKILIVEDYGNLYFQFKETLEKEFLNIDVISATFAAEARWMFDSEKPDFIILDLTISPKGLTKEEVDETIGGRLTGWIWFRNYVLANDFSWAKKVIVYSGYIDFLKQNKRNEINGINLIDKKSNIEEVINEMKKMIKL